MTEPLTAEQQADARTRDVMAFAYTDTDGKLYTVNQSGERVEAPAGTPALSAEYQAIAERTAALVISYSKIINLTPADRSVLAQLANGQRQVDETITASVRDAWESIRGAADESGALPNIPGAGLATETAGAVAGAYTGSGYFPALINDLLNAGGDVANQFGGGLISRENAIAIGTAYASARQAAAAGRPAEIGAGEYFQGLFSRHWGSYLGAGLGWLLDKTVGLIEMVPGIGDWVKQQGWSSNQTLAQHLERNIRDDDNVDVAQEMAELDRVGGQDAAHVATLLTTGGTVRDSAGNTINIAAADSANAAPGGPAAAGAPTTPDEALALAEANQRPLGERVGTAWANADFSASNAILESAGPGGVALGTATAGVAAFRTGAGFAGAVNYRQAMSPTVAAYNQYAAAQSTIQPLQTSLQNAEAGVRSGLRFRPEDVVDARANFAAAERRVASLADDLLKMGVDVDVIDNLTSAERLDAVKDARYAHLAGSSTRAERLDAVKDARYAHLAGSSTRAERWAGRMASNVETPRAWYNPARWPGMWGRGAGYVADSTVNVVGAVGNSITTRVSNFATGTVDEVRGWFGYAPTNATASATAAPATGAAANAAAGTSTAGATANATAAAGTTANATAAGTTTNSVRPVPYDPATAGSGRIIDVTPTNVTAAASVAETAADAAPAAARSGSMLSRLGARLSSMSAGRFTGLLKVLGIGAAGAAAVMPIAAAANTGDAISRGDTTEARIRGGETAAYGAAATASFLTPAAAGAAATAAPAAAGATVAASSRFLSILGLGATRIAAAAAPIMETANLASGIAHNDRQKTHDAGVNLATIGAFTAGGAALGLCGGPFAPLSVPVGAVGGMVAGGVVTAARSIYNMFCGDEAPQVAAAPAPRPAPRVAAVVNARQDGLTEQEAIAQLMQRNPDVMARAAMAANRPASATGFDAAAFARVSSTRAARAYDA